MIWIKLFNQMQVIFLTLNKFNKKQGRVKTLPCQIHQLNI